MRSSHIFEIVDFVNADIHLVLHDEIEELIGVLLKLLPCRNVIEQRRAKYLGVLRRESTVMIFSSPPRIQS